MKIEYQEYKFVPYKVLIETSYEHHLFIGSLRELEEIYKREVSPITTQT